MAGYKFPLQKLLDIRVDKEEESKRSFMEALRQKKLAEEKLEELKAIYQKFNVENKEDDIVRRRIKNNYLIALTKNIDTAKQEIEKRIEHVNYKREELKKSQVERKTVETLKEKRQALFIQEQDDKERKSNDEFALYSYIRKSEGR